MNFNQFLNENKQLSNNEKFEFIQNYCKENGYSLHALKKIPTEYKIVKEQDETNFSTIFGYALLEEVYEYCLKH